MKKLAKIIAVAVALSILLSGCSFIEQEYLENIGDSIYEFLDSIDIGGGRAVEIIESSSSQSLPPQDTPESSSQIPPPSSQAEKANTPQEQNKFWDYGAGGRYFNTVSPFDYYGRNQLPIEHREIYDNVVLAINSLSPEVEIKGNVTTEVAKKILNIVLQDYPQIFWLSEKYSIYSDENGYATGLKLNYKLSQSERDSKLQQLEQKSAQIISQIPQNATDYGKALFLHDYIVDNAYYDHTLNLPNSYNLYGVLLEGVGVCQGYTKAYQYLLYQVGIEALYVKGESRGSPHGWNVVRLDGQYYHTDITWDDPVSQETDNKAYTYFNITDSEILKDHTISTKDTYILPQCFSNKNNYYEAEGLLFNSLNKDEVDRLAQLIAKSVESGDPKITIKLQGFDTLYPIFIEDDKLFDAIKLAKKRYNAKNIITDSVTISTERKLEIVSFTVKLK